MLIDLDGPPPIPPQPQPHVQVQVPDSLQTSTDDRESDYRPEPVPLDAYDQGANWNDDEADPPANWQEGDSNPVPANRRERDDRSGPPVLPDAALYGPVGDLVRRVDPHTEADRAAVLITALVSLGNLIGPSPHIAVGATKHRTNLFGLIVGATAKARKGTATAEALRFANLVDPEWSRCQSSGIASGEGLIALVADPSDAEDERRVDRRALVIEEEFARLLNVGRREGSTVSTTLREAWDGKPLRITTKHDPLRVTDHLISVIGHITNEELQQKLTTVDVANGLANRFLFVHAERSKLLPSGGHLRVEDLSDLVADVGAAVGHARRVGEVRRTPDAEDRWRDLYYSMADDDPGGMLGSLTARAEPQVLRLALVYCLLDGADRIDVAHLDAAYRLWRYCRGSADYVFGDALGDPVADRIDATLRDTPNGLDRTQLRELFGRHVRRPQMDAALELLTAHRRITSRTEDTGGRPRTIYTSRRPKRS